MNSPTISPRTHLLKASFTNSFAFGTFCNLLDFSISFRSLSLHPSSSESSLCSDNANGSLSGTFPSNPSADDLRMKDFKGNVTLRMANMKIPYSKTGNAVDHRGWNVNRLKYLMVVSRIAEISTIDSETNVPNGKFLARKKLVTISCASGVERQHWMEGKSCTAIWFTFSVDLLFSESGAHWFFSICWFVQIDRHHEWDSLIFPNCLFFFRLKFHEMLVNYTNHTKFNSSLAQFRNETQECLPSSLGCRKHCTSLSTHFCGRSLFTTMWWTHNDCIQANVIFFSRRQF